MLGGRRVDRIRNGRIRDLCNVEKGVSEVVSENVLRWHRYVKRMNENRLGINYMRVNVVIEEGLEN